MTDLSNRELQPSPISSSHLHLYPCDPLESSSGITSCAQLWTLPVKFSVNLTAYVQQMDCAVAWHGSSLYLFPALLCHSAMHLKMADMIGTFLGFFVKPHSLSSHRGPPSRKRACSFSVLPINAAAVVTQYRKQTLDVPCGIRSSRHESCKSCIHLT